jgi:hypothetical protein
MKFYAYFKGMTVLREENKLPILLTLLSKRVTRFFCSESFETANVRSGSYVKHGHGLS